MLTIKTPATSANLGVGFDTLGLALNLYNEYTFEASDTFEVVGFDASFSGKDNLVLNAYFAFAENYEVYVKPVKITQTLHQIPISRGLGSSASCIIAGVLAANDLLNLNQSYETCIGFAAKMEGHADNVTACALGNLTATFHDEALLHYDQFKIHPSLRFYVLIPKKGYSTESLRQMLPESVYLKQAVHNVSRMAFVPHAFEKGDIKLLKSILKDRLHEPYRYETIPHKTLIESLSDHASVVSVISGSGPTMLFISDHEIHVDQLPSGVSFLEVKVAQGTEVTHS